MSYFWGTGCWIGTAGALFISNCGFSVFLTRGVAGSGGARDGHSAEEYDVLLRLGDICGTVEKVGTCCDELWQHCCDHCRYCNTPWLSGRGDLL
jgi:hypothetical protein